MAAPFELFQSFQSVPWLTGLVPVRLAHGGTGEDSSLWELLVLTGTSISSGCVWSGLSSVPSRGGCREQQRNSWSAGSSVACWQLCFAVRWFAPLNSEQASRVLWLPRGCSAGARCAPSRCLRSAAWSCAGTGRPRALQRGQDTSSLPEPGLGWAGSPWGPGGSGGRARRWVAALLSR